MRKAPSLRSPMARATEYPCVGPQDSVLRIRRSSVPCRRSSVLTPSPLSDLWRDDTLAFPKLSRGRREARLPPRLRDEVGGLLVRLADDLICPVAALLAEPVRGDTRGGL